MQDAREQFRLLFWWSFCFFLVYVGIHFWLNLTAQGFADGGVPSPGETPAAQQAIQPGAAPTEHGYTGLKKIVVELSGPVTISLCSSLLIMSYGSFLIHGLKHLSVSLPTSFFKAFIIFIGGQIAVQIVGHWEIWVTNYNISSPIPLDPLFSWPSTFSYAIAFAALYILENYEFRVFDRLRLQIPETEVTYGTDAHTMARLTIISIVLILLKLIIVQIDVGAKFGMVLATLAAEFAIAIYVIHHLWSRSVRRPAAARQAQT